MTQFYPPTGSDSPALHGMRFVFGSAMAAALILAVRAIQRRDFQAHAAWMIRGYAIGQGAGAQVLTHLPWFLLVGTPGPVSRAVLMGAGWLLNLVVAEWIVSRRLARSWSERNGNGDEGPPAGPEGLTSRRCRKHPLGAPL
jgi:hypothetical protein